MNTFYKLYNIFIYFIFISSKVRNLVIKIYIVYSNTYKVSNNGQLIKLESNILNAQTLIVTDDDGSLESADETPTAAVIENGNVTGIVMSKANDANITQYELRPNSNASK